jgi:hypothetical protein
LSLMCMKPCGASHVAVQVGRYMAIDMYSVIDIALILRKCAMHA